MTDDELIYLGAEVWRECPGFPTSSVSSLGRVRGASGKILAQHPNKYGYMKVRLYCPDDRRKSTQRVHRLVALAFIPNPDGHPEVHHRDVNTRNNTVLNLEWVTRLDNEAYKYAEEREVCGHNPSYYY